MRYISIDIETTGLDPGRDQVLSVAMVAEDTFTPNIKVEDLPTFSCLVRHERYSGDAYALAMNAKLLEQLAGKGKAEASAQVFDGRRPNGEPAQWEEEAMAWLRRRPAPLIAAGKNVAGFDLKFFHPKLRSGFHHRVIDPGSVFIDWDKDAPLGLGDLLKNIKDGGVSHTAVDDARDVIRVLRRAYAPHTMPLVVR